MFWVGFTFPVPGWNIDVIAHIAVEIISLRNLAEGCKRLFDPGGPLGCMLNIYLGRIATAPRVLEDTSESQGLWADPIFV